VLDTFLYIAQSTKLEDGYIPVRPKS